MPPINRQFDMVHSDEWSMKVAFASSDYRHVDQHFGATPRLVVYGVKASRVQPETPNFILCGVRMPL